MAFFHPKSWFFYQKGVNSEKIAIKSLQAMIMREEEQAPVQSNNSLTEKGFVQLRLEDIKKSPGYMDDSIASSSAHQPLLQHDASEGN